MEQGSAGVARAVGYFDISASTILWHEARSRDQGEEAGRCQEDLAHALATFFAVAITDAADAGLLFVNTTGDGFLVVSHSTYWSQHSQRHDDPNYHPAQVMYAFTRRTLQAFSRVRAFVDKRRFLCRKSVCLRVALHYGRVQQLQSDGHVHFFGDALNYASRLLDSGVARRNRLATSRVFFARFHRIDPKDVGVPAERLADRNKYPEPIEVYDLHNVTNAKHRIERVREYRDLSPTGLKRIVFDAARVGRVLPGASAAKGRNTPSSAQYDYMPKGSRHATLVEFLIEPKYRRRGVAAGPGARLKIKHSGFENQPESVWLNELHEWDARLTAIGTPSLWDREPRRLRDRLTGLANKALERPGWERPGCE